MSNKKKCIHKYLTLCKTNPQPPGLGDFLRGTITLFKYSQLYGYDLFIDKNSHPFFSFLRDCQYFIADDDTNNQNVLELIPPKSYEMIDVEINKLFISGQDFSLLTNAFYTKHQKTINKQEYYMLSNFGNIYDNWKEFMTTFLTPNDDTRRKLAEYYNKLINADMPYTVIHLRFGDKFLNEGHFDKDLLEKINHKITTILSSNQEKQFVLITDSSSMAKSLTETNQKLFYKENKKVHMGDLKNGDIEDTVLDFFVISRASEIYSMNESAFSKLTALIFDINYILI